MAEIIGRSGDGFSGTAFFTKTYDEAVGLVVEARNYFAAAAAAEASGLTVAQQLGYCRESLRLTSRLMQIYRVAAGAAGGGEPGTHGRGRALR